MTYVATAVAGAADTQNVTISNISAGTFTANGAETIAITTSLAKSTLTNVSSGRNDETLHQIAGRPRH